MAATMNIWQRCYHVFFHFDQRFREKFSTATFESFWALHGHFTATHGYEFSTAIIFFKTATFEESGRDDGHLATLLRNTTLQTIGIQTNDVFYTTYPVEICAKGHTKI
jgi:hypothetical protein